MNHLFIVNPLAGKGKPLKLIPVIEDVFRSRPNEKYTIELVKGPGHASSIAGEYMDKGIDRIYSVGGDGTLNTIVNGIMRNRHRESCTLAAIPAGSGNDFIKSLQTGDSLYRSDSPDELLIRTMDGREKTIDVAKVNEDFYINIASLGFDGEVADMTNKLKRIPLYAGKFAYLSGVFFTLVKCTRHRLSINIDGHVMDEEVLLTAVANGKYYGGGMKAAPNADISDGLLEICLIKRIGRLKIIMLLPKFIKGLHGSIPEVSFHKAARVEVTCHDKTPVNIDGEVKFAKKAVFEIIPAAIRFVVPAPRHQA